MFLEAFFRWYYRWIIKLKILCQTDHTLYFLSLCIIMTNSFTDCSCIDDNNDDDQDVDGGDLVDRSVGQLSLWFFSSHSWTLSPRLQPKHFDRKNGSLHPSSTHNIARLSPFSSCDCEWRVKCTRGAWRAVLPSDCLIKCQQCLKNVCFFFSVFTCPRTTGSKCCLNPVSSLCSETEWMIKRNEILYSICSHSCQYAKETKKVLKVYPQKWKI